MLIESKIKIGHDNTFDICQSNFKSAHLLHRMALVQSQCSRTVATDSDIENEFQETTHCTFKIFYNSTLKLWPLAE